MEHCEQCGDEADLGIGGICEDCHLDNLEVQSRMESDSMADDLDWQFAEPFQKNI